MSLQPIRGVEGSDYINASFVDVSSVVFPTPTLSVGVGRMFKSVCLFVCLFVCPEHNSETNNPRVFKLGIGNDL